MERAYYANSIVGFLSESADAILGRLVQGDSLAVEAAQRDAWLEQIRILKAVLLQQANGSIYLEYVIPRLGKRVDTILLIGPLLFVIEFKVGEHRFTRHAADQVVDYTLDLKHFHEASHHVHVAPILVATNADDQPIAPTVDGHGDR